MMIWHMILNDNCINDLAYEMKTECKMFADYTTLYAAHDDINSLISKFKKDLDTLIAWCRFNKLDLNWSKTFFAFERV